MISRRISSFVDEQQALILLRQEYWALASGLAQERMADPEAVGEELLGELLSLLYDGLVHRAQGRG